MANQKDTAVIDLVINGKQGEVTMKALTAATVNQRKALYQLAETDPGYARQKKQLEALMAAQQQRIVRINQEKTAWQRFMADAGSVTAGVSAAGLISTGIGLVSDGLRKAREEYKAFNAASQELSAVTGATGADLEYLNKQAKQTGPALGKSGAEMLEAYKLMASAKPELLDQKELLVETTKAAITLSRAGKIDLAEATTVTAESLNQFNAGADQANRFINVIAAGAKEGSAEINEMGAALKNSGTVAAAQNVSFEQTNAALQSLSTIALKGGEAGTMLRNVLLTLGSGSDDTNPKVVGLEKALENLGKKNLSTAQLTKLFGKENVIAAQHIIGHREEIALLTDKVSGTSEAYSQAAKNNDTYEQKVAVFDATMSKLGVTLGTHIIPLFTGLMEGAVSLANWFDGQLTPAADSATSAFEAQRDKVNDLTKNLSPLLERHDQLKAKTILTKDEQAELKSIVAQVASVVPSAVTEFDNYGHALGINTEKAREFIEVQKQLLKVKNEEAIAENKDQLQDEKDELATLEKYRKRATDGSWDVVQADKEQLDKVDARRKELIGKIAGRQALINELSGDNLKVPDSPKPTGPTPPAAGGSGSGGSGSSGSGEETKEQRKARLKREKEEREKEARIKANKEATLAIEEMEMNAIADEKERELARAKWKADKEREQARTSKATAELKAKWIAGIDDALKAEQLRINQKFAEKEFEQEKKRMEGLIKLAEKELAAKLEAEKTKAAERQAAGGITAEEAKALELDAEAQFLTAKELLYQAHYVALQKLAGDNADLLEQIQTESKTKQEEIDQAQTDNVGKQASARISIREAETQRERQEQERRRQFAQDEKEFRQQLIGELSSMLLNDWTATVKNYKEFWKQATLVQKAAMVASKAFALAEIAINLSRQITAINTAAAVMNAFLPGSGTVFQVAGIAKAIGSAALQTAKIVAATGGGVPAFADGGFTDEQPGGYTNGPTYYTKRGYVAGEAGREWIMSAPMLQNPVMANLAGALQALQVSGQYRNLSSLPAGGDTASSGETSGGMSDALLLRLIESNERNGQRIEELSKRPIMNNYRLQREFEDEIQQIELETGL